MVEATSVPTTTTIENFTMVDGENGNIVQFPTSEDPVRALAFVGSDDVSLSNFMARPVLLTSATWQLGIGGR
jgi:hypothetical protein